MTSMIKVITFVTIFFFSFSLWAEEVRIDIGRGRLTLKGLSGEKDLRRIEIELLIDEDLASVVMGNHLITIQIDGGELEELDGGDLKERIKAIIQEQLKSSTSFPQDQEGKDRHRVIMDSQHFVVEYKEFYDEIVVIGGQVDVYGTVGTLVLISGRVHIHESGVVEKDLVVIGGHLQKTPGATVSGSSVGTSPFLVDSWNSVIDDAFNNYLDLKSWAGFGFFIFEMLVVIFTLWLCMYLFPPLHHGVKELILQSPERGLVFGLLYVVLLGPVTIGLFLSLIGMTLLPLIFSLSLVFVFLGYGEAALWLGSQLNKQFSLVSPKQEILLAIVGLIFVEIIVLIPYVGIFVKWGFYMMGFGFVLGAFYRVVLKS